jgi:hypothetical protein
MTLYAATGLLLPAMCWLPDRYYTCFANRGGGAALALDRRRAAHDRAAFRPCYSRRKAQRQQRRDREQEIAEAWMHPRFPAKAER